MEENKKNLLRKVLIISGIIFCIPIFLLLFSYLFSEIQFQLVVKKRISDLPNYYQEVANNCIVALPTQDQKNRQECCLNSLRQMAQGDYKPAPLAFTDDPSRGCGATYVKLHCAGSLEWCDENSREYPGVLLTTIEQKDIIIDDSIAITFPKFSLESNEYSFVKEKDQTNYGVRFATQNGFLRGTLTYIGSIGTWQDFDGNGVRDLSSTFLVYKFNAANLKEKVLGSLPDWIKQLQEGVAGDDIEKSLLRSIQAQNQILLRGEDNELVYFHIPEHSDNGWYAYRYKNQVYFFSMGNNSEAVKGEKAGLWDKAMFTLRSTEEPYKISEKDFKATLGEARKNEIFSIPSDTEVSSFCPECEEQGIDLINGQNWEFAVSDDHKRYAYMAYKDGKDFVVLDGVTQKNYDRVYFLKFSPNGKYFSYHAYDESRKQTFLVLNGQEISVYPGDEGYPQAANGVSEAYSDDGQFSYAKVTESEPKKMEIYRNGKLINTVEGELIHFWFSKDDQHLEYVVLGREKSKYYIDSHLKKDDVDYNEYATSKNKLMLNGKEVAINYEGKGINVNGTKLVDYQDQNPEVYLTSLTPSPSDTDIAYKIWMNKVPGWQKVFLNGKYSGEEFNAISDIRFSDDGKTLSYVGRIGRSVYFVTHEVFPQE